MSEEENVIATTSTPENEKKKKMPLPEDYISVAEFAKKHTVPSSTLYYMLNREFVKLRMIKVKYGKRKKFSEAEMTAALAERLLM